MSPAGGGEAGQHIRAAAAHEAAATRHEDRYEQQMRSAGASMYRAFCIALAAAPEFQGRQITDKSILRIYQSPKKRPWWDKELEAAKFLKPGPVTALPAFAPGGAATVDRERAARLIQWHIDLPGAQARRAKHALSLAAGRKRLAKQGDAPAHGARAPRAEVAPTRKEADRGVAASHEAALQGRELVTPPGSEAEHDAVERPRAEILALFARLQSKARRVSIGVLSEAADMLEAVERDFDEALRQGDEA